MGETTTGDFYRIQCPACGAEIRDLWDGGAPNAGEVIECDHCQALLVVDDVWTNLALRTPEEGDLCRNGCARLANLNTGLCPWCTSRDRVKQKAEAADG